MTDEEAVVRGAQAAEEWRHTEAAFDQVEKVLVDRLIAAPVSNEALIQKLHMALQNCAAVRQAIMNVIQTGQMAEAALAQVRLTSPH